MAEFGKDNMGSIVTGEGEQNDNISDPVLKNDVENDNDGLPVAAQPIICVGVAPTYCGICSLPPEYCEYGPTYEKCLQWALENCRESLSAVALSKAMGEEAEEEGEEGEKKKKKRGGAGVPKKKSLLHQKLKS